jgi:hypothetical protein
MSWIRPAAITAGAAVAGIGLATMTRGFAKDHSAASGERYWNRQIEGKDRSATDYYGGSAVFEMLGAIGLAVGGAALLFKNPTLGREAAGGAMIVAAGALGGYSVGAFQGFSKGEEAAFESHGVNIQEQVDRLMRNFDHDGDHALSTSSAGLPEFLYRYQVDIHRDGYPPTTKWASIENFVKAADANGDGKATRGEIVDKLDSFDGNHNGLLSSNDGQRLREAGLEHVAIEKQILETDPWGAYVPVEW